MLVKSPRSLIEHEHMRIRAEASAASVSSRYRFVAEIRVGFEGPGTRMPKAFWLDSIEP